MDNGGMRRIAFLTLLVAGAFSAVGLGAEPAGGAGARAQAAATLTIRSSAYGRVLFDTRGRALYAFTRDRRGGPSRCYGACARAWPVYYSKGALRAGKGIKRGLVGTTRRRNGRRQVTYDGWPVYYYVGDRRPGEIRCQNVVEFGGTWLVVRPNGRLVR
jgi:predicted lipoprotein with Yx(FWY)xxD motif